MANQSFIPTCINEWKYNKGLVSKITSLLPESFKKGDEVELLDFPPPEKCALTPIKQKRELVNKRLGEKLQTLYKDKDLKLLSLKRPTGNANVSAQERYEFNTKISSIQISNVEVTCRMATSNAISMGNMTYKLSRIGSIKFKGEMKQIMETLLDKCVEELDMIKKGNVRERHPAALYAGDHSFHCPWPCGAIQEAMMEDKPEFFSNPTDSGGFLKIPSNTKSNKLCFYKRQLIGQGFIPYIDRRGNIPPLRNEENDLVDNDEDDEQFIFDNMFIDHDGKLAGVMRSPIEVNAPNFLSTVDMTETTALLSFKLHFVGITQGGMNLYLKPSDNNVIYCTKSSMSNEIESASDFLENQLHTSEKIQKSLPSKLFETFEMPSTEMPSTEPETAETPKSPPRKKAKSSEDDHDCDYDDDDDDCNENYQNKKTSILEMI